MSKNEILKKWITIDLEKELLSKGVSEKNIEILKSKTGVMPEDLEECYYYAKRSEEKQIIETSKISWFTSTRVNEHETLWTNIMAPACDDHRERFSQMRLAICFNHFFEDQFEDFCEWYQDNDEEPIKLNYYIQDDRYEVGGNGNHRTLVARVTNVPLLLATVHFFERDEAKYEEMIDKKKKIENDKKVKANKGFLKTCFKQFFEKSK